LPTGAPATPEAQTTNWRQNHPRIDKPKQVVPAQGKDSVDYLDDLRQKLEARKKTPPPRVNSMMFRKGRPFDGYNPQLATTRQGSNKSTTSTTSSASLEVPTSASAAALAAAMRPAANQSVERGETVGMSMYGEPDPDEDTATTAGGGGGGGDDRVGEAETMATGAEGGGGVQRARTTGSSAGFEDLKDLLDDDNAFGGFSRPTSIVSTPSMSSLDNVDHLMRVISESEATGAVGLAHESTAVAAAPSMVSITESDTSVRSGDGGDGGDGTTALNISAMPSYGNTPAPPYATPAGRPSSGRGGSIATAATNSSV
jgi:hypothetical protein